MSGELKLILAELEESLNYLSEKSIDQLTDTILNSNRIIVVGVGRVMISLKAWVKRMTHLGIDINYLGSETEGVIGKNDLVIIGSSSGESLIPKVIAKKAKSVGARTYYIGCTEKSSVDRLTDQHLILTGRTKFNSPSDFDSKQPMSTLFEQQLYLLGDAISLKIMSVKNMEENDVKKHHANLE